MRIFERVIITMAVLLVSGTTMADTWHTGHLRTIYPLSSGGFVLTFMEPIPACSTTGAHPYLYALDGQNNMTAEGLKGIMSVALAASAMGKRLSVNFDETSANCHINRAYIRVGIE